MRAILVLAIAAGLGSMSPAFAMGGGGMGGGMGMGGYGGTGMRSSVGGDDYATALRLIHHEKYSDAIPYLNRALQERPNNADVLNYLGYTHRMLGDYPGSLDFYQRALAREPNHKGAHEYLGELYLKMHQLASARAQLDELTRLCPSGCEEKDVLTKAITDYQVAAAAAAASAQATPAAATAPADSAAPQATPTNASTPSQ
ncbi:MAG TPA: tetratricopeptide repeat protein [Rhizomicrobium sp.]|jgi:tetratricopeptide (TPR) repeat protein|nr:tetratricopeptide repeat protein [Rhizomicrobium sp.]